MSRRSERNDAQAFDDAWGGRAPRDADIARLVRSVEALLEAASAEPDAAFRDRLRFDLMAEAETTLVATPPASSTSVADRPAPSRTASPARRRLAGVTAALVASLGVVGLVTSSASAVPGEALYPVKRGVENVALALHRGDASEGSFQLARASERLAEAQALADDGESSDLVADTLDDFASQADDGATSLFSDYSKTGSTASIDKVADFAASSSTVLAELSSRLPAGISGSLDGALGAVSDLAVEASSLCSTCNSLQTRSLVDTVSKLAAETPQAPEPSASGDTGPDPVEVTTPGDSASPAPQPIIILPTPTAPPTSLGDVTDPLVGALLGDDEQQGLVPGLLNGLLGGGQK